MCDSVITRQESGADSPVSSASEIEKRWNLVSSSLLRQGYWSRLGDLAKLNSLKSVPKDVDTIYDELEGKNGLKLNKEQRLMYFAEFTRAGLGSTTLQINAVESLIQRKSPEIMISRIDFLALVTSKFHELSKGEGDHSENTDYIDFKHFAAVLYDLLNRHEQSKRKKNGKWGIKDLMMQLPFDPDSPKKQAWDLNCMVLLLYCSFSIPYGIAFETDDGDISSVKEKFDQAVDIIFIVDIFLNFVTGWDNQGYIVKDFVSIAKNYLRTWFALDLAGSFPFDTVIAAFIDANQQSLGSTNLVRGLKLIKMVKLIRALKFVSKLQKLKQNEGFEGVGTFITLLNAAFALFFTSHILGCFYTILLSYEGDENWLSSYNPAYLDADAPTRYVLALYWAIVTIR